MRINNYSALVQSVLYHFNQNYNKPISMQSLADDLGTSENRLIIIFKKEIGQTPNAYLMKLRMHKAANLLLSGTMPISEVSAAVGIEDPNYFVKLFKKEFQDTPSTFRKRYTT